MKDCPYCEGGWMPETRTYWQYIPSYRCPDCEGAGYIREIGIDYDECERCGDEVEVGAILCEECEEYLEQNNG